MRRNVVEPLWTLGAIVSATRGTCFGAGETPVTGFSIDSRSLRPGEAFVAIRGPNRDGHAFVAAALDQGAACAIVDGTFPPGDEERLVRVGDTLEALNDLGRAARARATDTVIIAVTGSAGKTGTKEALKLALQPSGSVHASAKSFNNHWGVPLSLANMPKAVRFGVFEIGMNHAGEIAALVPLVRPHIAIVTTVAPVHLGFFRSVEEIADAKAEIFRGLEPGGSAIINRDSPYYERLKRHALGHGAKIVGFGETQDAEARLIEVELRSDGSKIKADILGETIDYRLGAPGRHLVQNSVAVLGDMLELGPEGPKLHQELAEVVDGAGVDVVFACGELMGSLFEALPASRRGAYTKTAEELAPKLVGAVGPGDAIMVKGSLGSRMAPLVEALKRRFGTEAASA